VSNPQRPNAVFARVGDMRLITVRIRASADSQHQEGSDAALFLTLANDGSTADVLNAVSSVDAGQVIQRDGAGPAEPIHVETPASGSVSLQHLSGLHLELVDLKRDVARGSFLPVTFRFAKAGPVTVKVFVQVVDQPVVEPLPSADASG
jgi:copper(I)-binding protein